jgi:AraC-like DNA-binding protein
VVAPAPFHYFEFDPAPGLVPFVTAYWGFEVRARAGAPQEHHVWPDACVALAVRLRTGTPPSVMVAGPRLQALVVPVAPGDRYWGIRFWPDTGGQVLGCRATMLRDRTVPAAELLGAGVAGWQTALQAAGSAAAAATALDELLSDRVARLLPPDQVVRRVVRAIVASGGTRPIAEVAASVDLSERQLQRRFRRAVGLTPKQFARIRRFRTTAATRLERRPRPWSTVAASLGFADQAHLIHEFSQLAGLTPVAFEDRLRAIDHGPVVP